MRPRPTHTRSALAGLLAFAILGCLAGCSKTSPTRPVTPAGAAESRYDAPSPVNVLRVEPTPAAPDSQSSAGVARVEILGPANPAPDDWRSIGAGMMDPDAACSIQAGRYTLSADAGSVESAVQITISDYDASVLDIELGPDGLQFTKPVTLSVSYAGTQADPASPTYDGSDPQVVWYNEEAGRWVVVPGTVNPGQLTITVKLFHFSRYAVQKASW